MTHCEAHPHVKQMYPCEECMAEYYSEIDLQWHHATEEACYRELQWQKYEAYFRTRLYREKCLQWLNHTQYGTPLPDWYYYA